MKHGHTSYTKTALTALAAAGLLAAAGTAQASFQLNTAQQDDQSADNFAGDAFDAESDLLSRLDSSTTEDFESGFSHDDKSPTTDVGDFVRGPDAVDGAGNDCEGQCEEPAVFNENDDTSNSGRYDTTGADSDYYLDSNDVTQVEWDIEASQGDNALGFYLMDPSDQGATFEISTDDGNTELFSIDSNQPDGELFYISAIATDGSTITDASLFLENADNTQADGFGIDDATVGVPTPGMLAMLGSGLLALGLFGRGRGKSAAA